MIEDVKSSAAALYDGGWRSEDREDMIAEYNLSENEADVLCKALKDLETEASEQ